MGKIGTRISVVILTLALLLSVFAVSVSAADELTAALSAEPTTIVGGNTVTLKGSASGGSGNYQYKFIVLNTATDSWWMIQDFSSAATAEWDTGSAGEKILYLDVKDMTTGKVNRASLKYTVKESDLESTLTSKPALKTVAANGTVKLTAAAKAGAAPFTYKFIVHNTTTDQWYKLQDFSSASTYDWFTGTPGSKTIYADIKDKTGKVVRTGLDFTVKALSVKSFTCSKGTNLNPNVNTTLTAEAEGGSESGKYTYKFIVYNTSSNQWWKIQDFSSKNTCEWNSGAKAEKHLFVDVKDTDTGAVVRKQLGVQVGQEISVKLTLSRGYEVSANQPMTVTASAKGGDGNYQYKFTVYNYDTAGEYVAQNYSEKNSIQWNTSGSGNKLVTVYVKDGSGHTAAGYQFVYVK